MLGAGLFADEKRDEKNELAQKKRFKLTELELELDGLLAAV